MHGMHLGPRSAGNKSLLSYRAGHGITGYGGYCPSSESIPVPIKEGPSAMGAHGVRPRTLPLAWHLKIRTAIISAVIAPH